MILVDSSVWIDHLRGTDDALTSALNGGTVLCHPFVIGELGLGSLGQRSAVLADLNDLPQAEVAEHAEVLGLIEREALFGLGLGYVDVHLLAAARLTPDATLWTRDRRLHRAASRLSVAHTP